MYAAGPKTWTVTFSQPITRVTGPYISTTWKFRRNGAMVIPDDVWIQDGNVVCTSTLFDGLEIAVRYFGPPPTYATFRWVELQPFPWFYWP